MSTTATIHTVCEFRIFAWYRPMLLDVHTHTLYLDYEPHVFVDASDDTHTYANTKHGTNRKSKQHTLSGMSTNQNQQIQTTRLCLSLTNPYKISTLHQTKFIYTQHPTNDWQN